MPEPSGRPRGRRLASARRPAAMVAAAVAAGFVVALLRAGAREAFAGVAAPQRRPRSLRTSRSALELADAAPAVAAAWDASQVMLADRELGGGPFDGPVMWLMSFDRQTNENIERVIFSAAILLSLVSGKVNFDEWQKTKEKEDLDKATKFKNALDPDREWRKDVSKQESKEASRGFDDTNARRTRGKPRKKTPLDEARELGGP
mmetsp:Transcript_45942/g.121471  ORF Transcript_45942/g.121471 Transcript_45942/m.121471 type:complete len:204 (-) Transcript_45942:36-647(-)